MERKEKRPAGTADMEKLKELDSHWKEVMDLATQYGFICGAYGGTAVLATHRNQLDEYGEESYLRRQKGMHGIDMEAGGDA